MLRAPDRFRRWGLTRTAGTCGLPSRNQRSAVCGCTHCDRVRSAKFMFIESYSNPHMIEKKNSPRAASYASW
jgi:hypothetical protein